MLESWCGVVVGLMGEWWPVCAQVGPLCGSVGRVRLVFVCLSWCCGLCSLVAWGNCYHRRCFAACRRRVGGLWSQNPRVVAQSAVHLGGMRVTWGVWGVVDDGLGVVVRGEVFSAGRRVGYVGSQCVLPG